MSDTNSILLPVARVVQGDLAKRQPDTKADDGSVKPGGFFFALAVPKKGEAHWNQLPWGQKIWAIGAAAFPAIHANPSFAWKVEDGDSVFPNKKGIKNCDREGFPGHWIVKCSGHAFPPKTLTAKGDGPVPAEAIKCGHYVEALVNVKGNGRTDSPGVYMNYDMVAHSGFGPEIVSYESIDPTTVGFGGAPLPPGATASPVSALAPPAAPPPPTPVVPHATILAPPAPPVAHQMTATAPGTYEAMTAAGWNDDQLRQHGYML